MLWKRKGKGNADNYTDERLKIITKRIIPDQKLYTRKHCQFSMAGLLTCNIFAALPIPVMRIVGIIGKNLLCYLQLRDSS